MSEIKKPPSTIWEVPDELWHRIEPLINQLDPQKETGRPRADARRILDALIFRYRTGCQRNHIPSVFGDDSTILRQAQEVSIALSNAGDDWDCLPTSGPSLRKLRTGLIAECDELGQVDWEWQSADTAMGKARSGGDQIGPNPTDRAKNGSKRSILTDGGGGPLAAVVAGANVHDTKLLDQTIEAIVVERPEATEAQPQHLCLDKGYDNPTGEAAVNKHGYVGHIRRIGEEKLEAGKKKHPARRWVVERTLGWLSKPVVSGAEPMSRYSGAL